MQTIFFIGTLAPYAAELQNKLREQKFLIINSSIVDEVDQAGKQATKLTLIFFDFKFAIDFLAKGGPEWSGFEMLKILYLPAVPKISPEVEKKLAQLNLKIFHAKEMTSTVDHIEMFMNEASLLGSDEIELEFTVHSEKE